MEKITYTGALEIAIKAVGDDAVKAKLEALKAQLAKKNSAGHKPTATQRENIGYKETILNSMEEGKQYTVTDIQKGFDGLGELSNQRISALMHQLFNEGRVAREEIKRRAYFTKVSK